jgi:transcription initiation factor TFIIIB Brf1 subunit/transcription initiation factor TFIIB
LAAAALYVACIKSEERRIQKKVAEVAGNMKVILKNRLRGL